MRMCLIKWFVLAGSALLMLMISEAQADVLIESRITRQPYHVYYDTPARFGEGIPDGEVSGWVVPAQPLNGCGKMQPPPTNVSKPDSMVWISLIQRSIKGECTFQEKVQNAQDAKYDVVIVFNYKDDSLISMGGDDESLIPSVFIGATDGNKILKSYTYLNPEYVVRVTETEPFDINAYLLPFAIVVGVCFFIMLGIMVFKCIQDRRRERRHRLPKASLKKIPTKKFTAGDEEHYETCCICLDDYVPGDKLRILPCDHAYHMKCIDPWLLKNKRVCPQCRKKVFATGEVPPSDSDTDGEDERAPLLARQGQAQGGTFRAQNENPFRRAARRLAHRGAGSSQNPDILDNRASSPSSESMSSRDSSNSSRDGEDHHTREDQPVRVIGFRGTQVLTQVLVEHRRPDLDNSPPRSNLAVAGPSVNMEPGDLEVVIEEDQQEVEEDLRWVEENTRHAEPDLQPIVHIEHANENVVTTTAEVIVDGGDRDGDDNPVV